MTKEKPMHRRTALLISGLALLLLGCGPSQNETTVDTMDPDSLDLAQAIQDGKIPDFNRSDPIEDQYLSVINYLRSLKIKCNDSLGIQGPSGTEMEWNSLIADAAEEHSEDMRLSVYYGHPGSGTAHDTTGQTFTPARASTFSERIERNGFSATMSAENIAKSEASYALPSDYWLTTMEGWIQSDHGHCSNIMHPSLTQFGMHESRAAVDASGKYIIYWTQDFGAP